MCLSKAVLVRSAGAHMPCEDGDDDGDQYADPHAPMDFFHSIFPGLFVEATLDGLPKEALPATEHGEVNAPKAGCS